LFSKLPQGLQDSDAGIFVVYERKLVRLAVKIFSRPMVTTKRGSGFVRWDAVRTEMKLMRCFWNGPRMPNETA
jgi:hypothetical protein